MKKLLTEMPLLSFTLFALLIALRDASTQLLMLKSVDPLILIFIFFSITTTLAFGYKTFTSRGQPIEKTKAEGLLVKIGLGVITCAAFISTVFGIKFLGAPIFSLVEHCLIPISTLVIAHKLLKETVSRFMILGMIISLISVAVFIFASSKIELNQFEQANWHFGIFLAILASILTSVSSAFQKKLVDLHYKSESILFVRFLLPTIMTGALIIIEKKSFPSPIVIFQIAMLGCVFFALPLLLLLQGFVRSSLSRFSVFNILVPAFTFIVGSLFLEGEFAKWMNPWIILGITGIVAGYVIFEWEAIQRTIKGATK